MKLWRISKYVDLEGKGGLFGPARWHHKGRPVIYCAEHSALAVVEYLVNVQDRSLIPPDTVLFSIDVPSDVAVESIDRTSLPPDWNMQLGLTRNVGTEWLDRATALVLKVPAATSPHGSNYLLNPRHSEIARTAIVDRIRPPFDERLLRLK